MLLDIDVEDEDVAFPYSNVVAVALGDKVIDGRRVMYVVPFPVLPVEFVSIVVEFSEPGNVDEGDEVVVVVSDPAVALGDGGPTTILVAEVAVPVVATTVVDVVELVLTTGIAPFGCAPQTMYSPVPQSLTAHEPLEPTETQPDDASCDGKFVYVTGVMPSSQSNWKSVAPKPVRDTKPLTFAEDPAGTRPASWELALDVEMVAPQADFAVGEGPVTKAGQKYSGSLAKVDVTLKTA